MTMATIMTTGQLIARVGGTDVVIGTIEIHADGYPELKTEPEALKLAERTALAGEEGWTFRLGGQDG